MGEILFFSLNDIKNNFKNFDIIDLNEKKIFNYQSIKKDIFASWMMVAKKK